MITEFVMNHLFMSSIVLFGVVTIFLQWLMTMSLKGYVKASANMKTTRKKLLMNLKNQFETIYGMNYQVRNISAYVDKYLLKMRFLGLSFSTWERVPFLSVGIATMIAGGEAGYCYWTKQPAVLYAEIGFSYGAYCVMQFVAYQACSVRNRRQQIHIQLVDYLENYLTNRLIRTKVGNEDVKVLDAEMEAAFMEGKAKTKELKNVILEEDKAKTRKKEKVKKQEETEEDMEMLKRLLRDMGNKSQAGGENLTEHDIADEAGVKKTAKDNAVDEVAAGEEMEQSDIELLEEFVQSFLA